MMSILQKGGSAKDGVLAPIEKGEMRMSSMDRRGFLEATGTGLLSLPAARAGAAENAEDPLGVRADFPITRNMTFLNSAYIGPVSTVVSDAAVDYAREKLLWADSRGGLENKEKARARCAELFGAKPEEVALLYSTSDGENIVTRGLDFQAGHNVVVDELHFTTSFVLYRQLEEERGIELRIVPERGGRTRIEDFEARVDGRTRLLSVAWVSNRNGFRHDLRALAELAHAKGAFLYADAVQALGTFPTSLREEGVDFLTTGAYKWLFASFGVAPLFIREEHLERIPPDRYGHAQVAEDLPEHRFRLRTTAQKYEYASLAFSSVAQLDAALGYLKKVGLSRIEAHAAGLSRELREGIAKLGFEIRTPEGNRSPIMSFVHGQDPERLKRLLKEEAVEVTLRGENDSEMRASISMFNNRADVLRLLNLLENIV